MVLDVAARIDTAFVAGTGDPVGGKNTTPLGILNYPGVQVIGRCVRCGPRGSGWR
jgi:hypothetical protein